MRQILIPPLGGTVASARIVRWLKRKGDSVSFGEAVLEIETGTALLEVFAPVGGQLMEMSGDAGAIVTVGTEIGLIDETLTRSEVGAARQAKDLAMRLLRWLLRLD